MTPKPGDDALDPVAGRLRRGRARLVAASLASAGLLAIAAGTVAAAAVAVAGLLAPVRGISAPGAGTVLAVGAAVAAGSWLVLVGVSLVRLPSLIALARRGERRLDLEERFSAALEVAADTPDAGGHPPVHEALLRDAAARAELLTPDLFAPRLPRRALAVTTGAALVLAVAMTLPPGPVSTVTVLPSPQDRAATLEMLRDAAAAVAEDAAEREDAYLAALAQALERLGDDLDGGAIGDREAGEELDRLVDHLARAYGHEPGAARDLGATLAREGHELDVAARGGAPGPDAPRTDEAVGAAASPGGDDADDPTTLFADEADTVTEGERVPLERGEAPDRGAFAQNLDLDVEDPYDHDVEGMLEALARIGADTPQGDRALPGAGAEGDAGFGVAPLFADDAAPLPEWQDLEGERVELPGDPGAANRIRISVPPEVRLARLDDGGVGDGRWPRGREAAVGVDRLGLRHRDVVRAYFIAVAADAGAAGP